MSAPHGRSGRVPHDRSGRVPTTFGQALGRPEAEGGGALADGDRVVAAVSGGLDSCVLLHLLRFGRPGPALDVVVAHFDHRMRPSSGADARWLGGLCRAWALPLETGRADPPPSTEEEARRARYSFLEEVRTRVRARLVLTAHHADDQAETVLFRVLRGTGIAGLAGLPARREPGLLRPLLPLWRDDLEAYARAALLSWREDPSNENVGLARNAVRRLLLPEAERRISSGARRALVRLARIAAENEAAWEDLLPELLAEITVGEGAARPRQGASERAGDAPAGASETPAGAGETPGGAKATPAGAGATPAAEGPPGRAAEAHARTLTLDRAALLARHPALRVRLLRALARRLGVVLDEARTRAAGAFAATGASGHGIDLGSGLTLRRELDRLVLARRAEGAPGAPSPIPDRALRIPDAGPGRGVAVIGGRELAVAWGPEPPAGLEPAECFSAPVLRFPLVVRGRVPGDRILLPGGTKKLKKLFLERRIPREERAAVPVLADAEGEVLWVPGVARSARVEPAADRDAPVVSIGIG